MFVCAGGGGGGGGGGYIHVDKASIVCVCGQGKHCVCVCGGKASIVCVFGSALDTHVG